jgi:hypothetical protein
VHKLRADLEPPLETYKRELAEARQHLANALEQQTATSEVLSTISRSSGALEPVFHAMLDRAVRICDAKFGTMLLSEGDCFRCVTLRGEPPPAYVELRQREPVVRPGPNTALGRLRQTKQTIQVEDVIADKAYRERDPLRVATADVGGARTFMTVPMLKGGRVDRRHRDLSPGGAPVQR